MAARARMMARTDDGERRGVGEPYRVDEQRKKI
jgi:hypothetical protein